MHQRSNNHEKSTPKAAKLNQNIQYLFQNMRLENYIQYVFRVLIHEYKT